MGRGWRFAITMVFACLCGWETRGDHARQVARRLVCQSGEDRGRRRAGLPADGNGAGGRWGIANDWRCAAGRSTGAGAAGLSAERQEERSETSRSANIKWPMTRDSHLSFVSCQWLMDVCRHFAQDADRRANRESQYGQIDAV